MALNTFRARSCLRTSCPSWAFGLSLVASLRRVFSFVVLALEFALDAYICHALYIQVMANTDLQGFIPLKLQWFQIMLSLAGGEQHGYAIMQEVRDRTMGKVRLWPATLYGSIKRLIEVGLIEESDERPAPELDDARRRYYRLTALGRLVLDAECERLQELVRTIRAKQGMVTE
jgi:DNA-binding PadR family transcriptional regulator